MLQAVRLKSSIVVRRDDDGIAGVRANVSRTVPLAQFAGKLLRERSVGERTARFSATCLSFG